MGTLIEIIRYKNRKLYSKQHGRYITSAEFLELAVDHKIQSQDHQTGEMNTDWVFRMAIASCLVKEDTKQLALDAIKGYVKV